MKTFQSFVRVIASAITLYLCASAGAQQALRPEGEIGVAYTSLRFQQRQQYLGYGIDCRVFFHRSFGFEAEGSLMPETQLDSVPYAGYQTGEAGAAALGGHHWGRVAIYGEAGFGTVGATVFSGIVNGQQVTQRKFYKDFMIGGLIEVSVSPRWQLTYEARDNRTFTGRIDEPGLVVASYPPTTLDVPEGRIGIAYRF